jgi:predicted house-cleaning NTP pyrophosphatase (Maf/HAM1 superfamily)
MPEISTQVDFAPMWFETPDKPLKGGCSTNLEAGNDSKVPESSQWTYNYRMDDILTQEKKIALLKEDVFSKAKQLEDNGDQLMSQDEEIKRLKTTIASHKEGTEVFDLQCEISALKEEAVIAQNTEAEIEMTLSELREELVDANAELKAYEEKVEGLEKDGGEDIYGLDGNQIDTEKNDLRKTIVNLLPMKQAKTLIPKSKYAGCKHRGNCDDEDTLLGRLWGIIWFEGKDGSGLSEGQIEWDDVIEKIQEF